MIISPKFKLIFVHIPKTGGAAMYACLKMADNEVMTVGSPHIGLNILGKPPPTYRVFTVFRDPIELYVSGFEWIRLHKSNLTFEEYVKVSMDKETFNQWKYLRHPLPFPKYIVPFPQMREGVSELCGKPMSLPKNRATHFHGEIDYGNYFSDELREVAVEKHAGEIAFLERHKGDNVVEVMDENS